MVRQIFDIEGPFLLVMQDQNMHLPSHSNLNLFQWQMKHGAYVIRRDIDNFLGLPDVDDDEYKDDLPKEDAGTTTEMTTLLSQIRSKRQEIV